MVLPLHQVVAVGFDEDQAARHLERAFGWRSQVFWRGLKKEEVPDPGQVSKTMKYLTVELGELFMTAQIYLRYQQSRQVAPATLRFNPTRDRTDLG